MRYAPAIALFLTSFEIFASTCVPTVVVDHPFKEITFCENGKKVRTESHSITYKTRLGRKLYDRLEREVESHSWNTDGVATYKELRTYQNDGQYILEKFYFDKERKPYLIGRQLMDGDRVVKAWEYHQPTKTFRAIVNYDQETGEENRIEVLAKNEKVKRVFDLTYWRGENGKEHIKTLISKTPEGKYIGKFDEAAFPKTQKEFEELFEKIYPEDAKKLYQENQNKKKPVIIFDTGFDIRHPDLLKYYWNNPKDPLDGIDNDGNGRVDDTFGWHTQDDPTLGLDLSYNNINETLFTLHFPYPVSHGTHVAGVAMEGTKDFGLFAFAGDVSHAGHIKGVSEAIVSNQVGFVNMSFSIAHPKMHMAPPPESFLAMEKLIADNQKTLFLVAAGNSRPGADIDIEENHHFPASYNYENMMVIGALTTSDFSLSNYKDAKPAYFSKYGKKTVHIFAPGSKVNGAEVGGGKIRLSGTSMATPWTTNVALKASEINPKLSPMEIREIILKTALIGQKKLPCSSWGQVYPTRVYQVAQMKKDSPDSSIEELVLKARKEDRVSGEDNSSEKLAELVSHWSKNPF